MTATLVPTELLVELIARAASASRLLGFVDANVGGALAAGAALADVDAIGRALAELLGHSEHNFGAAPSPDAPARAPLVSSVKFSQGRPVVFEPPIEPRVPTRELVLDVRPPARTIACGTAAPRTRLARPSLTPTTRIPCVTNADLVASGEH